MLILAALMLLAAPQDAEAVRQAIVSRCAIPADRLVVEQWTDPEMEVLVVKGDGPLSDAQLSCLGTVLAEGWMREDGVNFTFNDGPLGERYEEVTRRERVAAARANLASRGVLRRLPVFDRERGDPAVFARRLERLCGGAPGSLLKVQEDNSSNIVLRIDGDGPISDTKFQRQSCAISALIATGFEPFGAVPPPTLHVTIP